MGSSKRQPSNLAIRVEKKENNWERNELFPMIGLVSVEILFKTQSKLQLRRAFV